MGKSDKAERAKERREKRLQEISLLRTIPYSDHQRLACFYFLLLICFALISISDRVEDDGT